MEYLNQLSIITWLHFLNSNETLGEKTEIGDKKEFCVVSWKNSEASAY